MKVSDTPICQQDNIGVDVFIGQLRTPSFPVGLVKTERDFIVRSVDSWW